MNRFSSNEYSDNLKSRVDENIGLENSFELLMEFPCHLQITKHNKSINYRDFLHLNGLYFSEIKLVKKRDPKGIDGTGFPEKGLLL